MVRQRVPYLRTRIKSTAGQTCRKYWESGVTQEGDQVLFTEEFISSMVWIASRRTSGSNTRFQSGRMISLVPQEIAIFAASENGDFSAPKAMAMAIRAWPAMKAFAAAAGTPRSSASSREHFMRHARVA